MQDEDLNDLYDKWQLQLRKGVLTFMVLALLEEHEMYGYALISSLSEKMAASMSEGTIYPLLNRMVRSGILTFDWRIMESGPARKYYQISDAGTALLGRMRQHWRCLNSSVPGPKNAG